MNTYVVTLGYDQDENHRMAVRPAHREYLGEQTAAGRLVLAGPLASGTGAMLVYRAEDVATVEAILAADPYFAGPVQAASVLEIVGWDVVSGVAAEPPSGGERSVEKAALAEVGPLAEVEDLLATLDRQRGFLRQTVAGMSEEQARKRSTVSALTLGGLVKHLTSAEAGWVEFVVHGDQPDLDALDWSAVDWEDPSPEVLAAMAARETEFTLLPQESLEGVLQAYAEGAERTAATFRSLSLDRSHPLPQAPWFEPGSAWTARRVLTHLIAETAHHTGHADIIREAIDGTTIMG